MHCPNAGIVPIGREILEFLVLEPESRIGLADRRQVSLGDGQEGPRRESINRCRTRWLFRAFLE